MKIQVRDDKGKPLGAIQIKVVDLDAKEVARQKKSAWRSVERWLLKLYQSKTDNPEKKSKKHFNIATKTIEVRISLPTLRWADGKNLWQKLRRASRAAQAGVGLCLLIIIVGLFSLIFRSGDQPASVAAAGVKKQPVLIHQAPPYATVLPAGKSIGGLGGWVKIPRPNGDAAYVYYDKLAGTAIRVSEQPLPASFKANPADSVAGLAQNSNANEKLSAGGTTIYIEDTSDGQQFVIFSKSGLLVLINSGARISTNDWVKYVSSLK